jgi:hypothetical protein
VADIRRSVRYSIRERLFRHQRKRYQPADYSEFGRICQHHGQAQARPQACLRTCKRLDNATWRVKTVQLTASISQLGSDHLPQPRNHELILLVAADSRGDSQDSTIFTGRIL